MSFQSYEVRIFLGKRRGYTGPHYPREELIQLIRRFQREHKNTLSVRLTETLFLHGDYEETGYEVAAAFFPTFQVKTPTDTEVFMKELAEYLMIRLDQNRVTVMTPSQTTILIPKNPETKAGEQPHGIIPI